MRIRSSTSVRRDKFLVRRLLMLMLLELRRSVRLDMQKWYETQDKDKLISYFCLMFNTMHERKELGQEDRSGKYPSSGWG